MANDEKFYLVDERHAKITGGEVVLENVLYFKLDKAQFDGKATKDHVKQYAVAYGQFKGSHPDYVPTLEDPVEIGASVAVPVVEVPVVEIPVEVPPLVSDPVPPSE